jgi:hypothetical protein
MLFFKRNKKGFGGFLEKDRIRHHNLEIKY